MRCKAITSHDFSQDCVGLDFKRDPVWSTNEKSSVRLKLLPDIFLDSISPFLSINVGCSMTTYTDNHIVGFYHTASYLKLVPKPLDCCRVWANISYFRISLSDTDLRANLIASSKWARVISGTGSSSSILWK